MEQLRSSRRKNRALTGRWGSRDRYAGRIKKTRKGAAVPAYFGMAPVPGLRAGLILHFLKNIDGPIGGDM